MVPISTQINIILIANGAGGGDNTCSNRVHHSYRMNGATNNGGIISVVARDTAPTTMHTLGLHSG